MLKLIKHHEDFRGEIYLIKGLKKYEEVTMLSTKKGFSRGGCVNRLNDEIHVVIEGSIHFFIGNSGRVMKAGGLVIVPKNMPHYFVSLTDSLVQEWGCIPEEKMERNKQFRKLVNNINKKNLEKQKDKKITKL